jgi:hypothetical protein
MRSDLIYRAYIRLNWSVKSKAVAGRPQPFRKLSLGAGTGTGKCIKCAGPSFVGADKALANFRIPNPAVLS